MIPAAPPLRALRLRSVASRARARLVGLPPMVFGDRRRSVGRLAACRRSSALPALAAQLLGSPSGCCRGMQLTSSRRARGFASCALLAVALLWVAPAQVWSICRRCLQSRSLRPPPRAQLCASALSASPPRRRRVCPAALIWFFGRPAHSAGPPCALGGTLPPIPPVLRAGLARQLGGLWPWLAGEGLAASPLAVLAARATAAALPPPRLRASAPPLAVGGCALLRARPAQMVGNCSRWSVGAGHDGVDLPRPPNDPQPMTPRRPPRVCKGLRPMIPRGCAARD